MTYERLASLFLVALASAVLTFGLSMMIVPFTTGFEESLLAVSAMMGIEQSSLILSHPAAQASVGFLVFVVPASGAGVLGLWFWIRVGKKAKAELTLEAEREKWGDEVLEWWLGKLVMSCGADGGLEQVVDRGFAQFRPHLVGLHARWMDCLSADRRQAPLTQLASYEVPRQHSSIAFRGMAAVFATVAGLGICWGVVNVMMLAWFGQLPVAEMEVTPAMLVMASLVPISIVAPAGCFAAGLLYLDRTARRQSALRQARWRQGALEWAARILPRVEELLAPGTASSLSLASSLLLATFEGMASEDRAELLLACHERNLLVQRLDLTGVNLINARLDGADLEKVHLVSARFDGASLKGTKLAHATLDGSSFRAASLQGTNFRDASCRGASFEDAACQESCFLGCDLGNASFAGANLWRAEFDRQESESIPI